MPSVSLDRIRSFNREARTITEDMRVRSVRTIILPGQRATDLLKDRAWAVVRRVRLDRKMGALNPQGAIRELHDHLATWAVSAGDGLRDSIPKVFRESSILVMEPLKVLGFKPRVHVTEQEDLSLIIDAAVADAIEQLQDEILSSVATDRASAIQRAFELAAQSDDPVDAILDAVDEILGSPRASTGMSYQAERIAQTTATQIRNLAAQTSMEALIGEIPELAAVMGKGWIHSGQGEEEGARPDHVAMDGTVVPVDESFQLPDGTDMLHPGENGAPLEHVVNCRCTETMQVDQSVDAVSVIDSILA